MSSAAAGLMVRMWAMPGGTAAHGRRQRGAAHRREVHRRAVPGDAERATPGTDGLVDDPGVDPDDALDSLGDLLRSADPADPDTLADTLVQRVPDPVDDIALLLMRFRTTCG
ncbi:SpoIIE family protein phosphatase [Streptomyces sp. HNM0645]|uniref:SpoIIE family protein phosphatase n=1 Tax=Streptomyces sp. HNM0645 TaxID=2782343 RepID=UPI0024B8670E|nr:SpoIIE family protein phosphatase [Streptomyces sp. HNM0645]MDI9886432.1 SpoIIE family protein phosphatase [Streptomyces sp. HNM0645]